MNARPHVEISTYLLVGPEGTTVTFADLVDCSPVALEVGEEIVVSSREMNVVGIARVRKILYREGRLVLDLNWGELQPLRRRNGPLT